MCAVLRLQLTNGTQQNLDGFMIQFNKNAHSLAPVSQVSRHEMRIVGGLRIYDISKTPHRPQCSPSICAEQSMGTRCWNSFCCAGEQCTATLQLASVSRAQKGHIMFYWRPAALA